ncbi:MAG: hypothetical protein K8S55_09985 [Phycisphaerae bacterium]|nr:hypothetical protein [Phycisphaerae bacterium]
MLSSAIIFEDLPEHDTCWSLITGVDGCLYIGVCGEMTGGLSAYVARYDPSNERIDYLFEIAKELGVPTHNGQAAHAKVHYSLLQDNEGIIYAATHCTGAPLGDMIWRPWNCWTHPVKNFSGSGLVAYDVSKSKTLSAEIFLPREGSRCMALAPERKNIYGISYPRNHFFIFDIERHQLKDLGRIGSINSQCIFTDHKENAYTTGDYGELIMCKAEEEELVDTGIRIPHVNFRDGFHNVLYDVTPCPDGESVFGVTWTFGERLFRYDFVRNKLYDYGKAYGPEENRWDHIINTHVGGLVFGPDNHLYFTANLLEGAQSIPHLIRMNPDSGKREVVGQFYHEGIPADHIARATADGDGNLYFAEVGNCPTKLFKYECSTACPSQNSLPPRRLWG